jgi:hypothetical protein
MNWKEKSTIDFSKAVEIPFSFPFAKHRPGYSPFALTLDFLPGAALQPNPSDKR